MRCVGYAVAGFVLVPIAIAAAFAVICAPLAVADMIGVHPLWGALFVFAAFGAFVGAVVCRERAVR